MWSAKAKFDTAVFNIKEVAVSVAHTKIKSI